MSITPTLFVTDASNQLGRLVIDMLLETVPAVNSIARMNATRNVIHVETSAGLRQLDPVS